MDWKLFCSTFAAIFIAELGDKTQLATFAYAAGGKSRTTIFLASACALVATSALAVLCGASLGRSLSPVWIRRAAGALFIGLGMLYLFTGVEE